MSIIKGLAKPIILDSDYRKFNSYPLPNIDAIWPSLKGAKYFTALDLRNGYYQIKVAEEDKPKIAFVCHNSM